MCVLFMHSLEYLFFCREDRRELLTQNDFPINEFRLMFQLIQLSNR